MLGQPLAPWGLDLVDCDLCGNTGSINSIDPDGYLRSVECDCMAKRRSLKQLKKSGLGELVTTYSFKSFQTPTPEEVRIKNIARLYCQSDPAWFYIYGRPGSGKTHLCTAIYRYFVQQRSIECFFFKWRDEIEELKGMKSAKEVPPELKRRLDKLKEVPLLYIDDFLKGRTTEADKGLAFEILNARYNQPSKRTIISSELSLQRVRSIDEAIGGRIEERAGQFIVKAPDRDWRRCAR